MFGITFLIMNQAFADYGGVDKYPVTSCTGSALKIIINGVEQAGNYYQNYTANTAAVAASQKCGCKVTIKTPDVECSTKFYSASSSSSKSSNVSSSSTAQSSSKSSSSSSSALTGYIEWQAPTLREDGSRLDKVEAFHIRQKLKSEPNYAWIIVSGKLTSYPLEASKGDVMIAAQDNNGVLSEYVPITIKQRVI